MHEDGPGSGLRLLRCGIIILITRTYVRSVFDGLYFGETEGRVRGISTYTGCVGKADVGKN